MTDKTIADVLDKSVDKLSGGAAEVAKAIKQMAPHAWEVAVRQQAIEGWAGLITCSVVIALCAAVALVAKPYIGEKKYSSDGGGFDSDKPNYTGAQRYPTTRSMLALLSLAAAMVVSVGCACGVYSSALQVANPEYYAAQAFLGAIK